MYEFPSTETDKIRHRELDHDFSRLAVEDGQDIIGTSSVIVDLSILHLFPNVFRQAFTLSALALVMSMKNCLSNNTPTGPVPSICRSSSRVGEHQAKYLAHIP